MPEVGTAPPRFYTKNQNTAFANMQDLIFQDDLYFTFTSEQAEWAVCMWNKVLLYRGIMSGRIPSEGEMNRLKQAAPGVLNGSPQEDLGYILHSASLMYGE